jgi:hypothetical protein
MFGDDFEGQLGGKSSRFKVQGSKLITLKSLLFS